MHPVLRLPLTFALPLGGLKGNNSVILRFEPVQIIRKDFLSPIEIHTTVLENGPIESLIIRFIRGKGGHSSRIISSNLDVSRSSERIVDYSEVSSLAIARSRC